MTLELLILFAVSVGCDMFGQTFVKLGAIGGGEARTLPPVLWIGMGLVVYVVEIFVWPRVLAIAPLTVAAPIASLNYIGVVLIAS